MSLGSNIQVSVGDRSPKWNLSTDRSRCESTKIEIEIRIESCHSELDFQFNAVLHSLRSMILFQFSVSDQAHSKIDTAVTDVVGPLVLHKIQSLYFTARTLKFSNNTSTGCMLSDIPDSEGYKKDSSTFLQYILILLWSRQFWRFQNQTAKLAK